MPHATGFPSQLPYLQNECNWINHASISAHLHRCLALLFTTPGFPLGLERIDQVRRYLQASARQSGNNLTYGPIGVLRQQFTNRCRLLTEWLLLWHVSISK